MKFADLAYLDFRSLAAFRISLAGVFLVDLLSRSRDFLDHYTNAGVLPSSATSGFEGVQRFVPFLDTSGCSLAAFFLGAIAGLALLSGWRTRSAGFLCWLVLLFFHHRNVWVSNAGDVLLRMLMLWGLFLPLGQRWAVGGDRVESKRASAGISSVGTLGLMIQVCLVYFVSAMAKGHSMWRTEGSAVEHVLRLESFHTAWTPWLAALPEPSLRLGASLTLWLEEIGPFLLLVSFNFPAARTALVMAFFVFHLAFILPFLNIGLFPFICASAWCAFLPGGFWDGLCRFLRAGFLGVAIPEALAAGKPEATAMNMTVARLSIRDVLPQVLPTLLLVFVLAWNLLSFPTAGSRKYLPAWTRDVARFAGLNQTWTLFAPMPATRDGWVVSVARLSDGTEVDIARNAMEVSWSKPPSVADEYPNHRWHCYIRSLFNNRNSELITAYSDFLIQKWKGRHPQRQVVSLQIFFMLSDSLYPEDGIQKVRMYPIERIDQTGKAVFSGDWRRNRQLYGEP